MSPGLTRTLTTRKLPTVQAFEIDWAGIRAAAAVIGIRAAARNAAAGLSPAEQARFVSRVLKRADRQNWTGKARKALESVATKSSAVLTLPASSVSVATATRAHRAPCAPVGNVKPLSSQVFTGAEAIENKLADDSKATRLGFSTAARRHAEHFAGLHPSTDKDRAVAVRNWSQVAGSVHGWNDREPGTQINLNVLTINGGI